MVGQRLPVRTVRYEEVGARDPKARVGSAVADRVSGRHDRRKPGRHPAQGIQGSDYAVQRFRLYPADRLMIVSDGVFDAVAANGQYGQARSPASFTGPVPRAPLQAVRSLLGDLRIFLGDAELDDDAVAVCLDWSGPA
ncbi:MAG: SpoIIE family protein phosphatase [Actinoplanes sp.]